MAICLQGWSLTTSIPQAVVTGDTFLPGNLSQLTHPAGGDVGFPLSGHGIYRPDELEPVDPD